MRVFHQNDGHDVLIQYWMDRVPRPDTGPNFGPTTPARDGVVRIPIARGMLEAYYLPKDIDQAAGMRSFKAAETHTILFPARNPTSKTGRVNYRELLFGA